MSPCGTTGCYYRQTSYNSDSGYYRPTLAYGGWYDVQTTFGNGGAPTSNSTHVNYQIYHKTGQAANDVVNQTVNIDHRVDWEKREACQPPISSTVARMRPPVRWPRRPAPTSLTTSTASMTDVAGFGHARTIRAAWLHSHVGQTQIDVSWTGVDMPPSAPAPANGFYELWRKIGLEGEYSLIATIPGQGTNPGTIEYPDTGLTPGDDEPLQGSR